MMRHDKTRRRSASEFTSSRGELTPFDASAPNPPDRGLVNLTSHISRLAGNSIFRI